MWYVIQTMGGKELHVLGLMQKLVEPGLLEESFVPRYEVKKRIQGEWQSRFEVLLPGYIFIVTDDPDRLESELRSVPKFTRILRSNDKFFPLDNQEVAFINAFTEPGHRVVGMSTGVIEGDEIVVLSGPLMGRTALIRKIDRHKRLAYLDVSIMGRSKTVKVGLEIVRKRD